MTTFDKRKYFSAMIKRKCLKMRNAWLIALEECMYTSKMRFTNNRLTGLQTDKTWLGSSRVSRMQQNYKCTWLMVIAPVT